MWSTAGCVVRGGGAFASCPDGQRWAIQAFKEAPEDGSPPPPAFFEVLDAHEAAAAAALARSRRDATAATAVTAVGLLVFTLAVGFGAWALRNRVRELLQIVGGRLFQRRRALSGLRRPPAAMKGGKKRS